MHACYDIFGRLVHVKKSLETTVVTASTGKTSYNIIILSQAIVLFNFICAVIETQNKTGRDKSKFLLYHACVAPQSDYSVFFLEVMPINQFILYVTDTIIILGNLYLYRFLKKQDESTVNPTHAMLSAE